MKYEPLEKLKGFEITISSSNFNIIIINFKSFFFYSSSSFYFFIYFSNEFSSSFIELNEKQEKGVIALFNDLKSPKEFCKPKINILSNFVNHFLILKNIFI